MPFYINFSAAAVNVTKTVFLLYCLMESCRMFLYTIAQWLGFTRTCYLSNVYVYVIYNQRKYIHSNLFLVGTFRTPSVWKIANGWELSIYVIYG